MFRSLTIESDIEYKNKNVSKNMLRIFEAHFRGKIKNILRLNLIKTKKIDQFH